MFYHTFSYLLDLLWDISHPGRNGTPQLDLSEDAEASVSVESLRRLSPRQLALLSRLLHTIRYLLM